MDPDPMQFVEEDDDKKETKATTDVKRPKANLNTWVAISVALLATFMGICKVKDDNICQAMQQAQADKIDNYSWYQARNIREEVAKATVAQLTAQAPRPRRRRRPLIRNRSKLIRRWPRTRQKKEGPTSRRRQSR